MGVLVVRFRAKAIEGGREAKERVPLQEKKRRTGKKGKRPFSFSTHPKRGKKQKAPAYPRVHRRCVIRREVESQKNFRIKTGGEEERSHKREGGSSV